MAKHTIEIKSDCLHCAVSEMIISGAFGGPETLPDMIGKLVVVIFEMIISRDSEADKSVCMARFSDEYVNVMDAVTKSLGYNLAESQTGSVH